EVDEYDSFYKKNVQDLGYSSIYIQRGGRKRDGCAIFYKVGSAEVVVQETIDYNDLVGMVGDESVSMESKEESGSSNFFFSFHICNNSPYNRGNRCLSDPQTSLKRDCVGLMALFKLKDPSSHHIIISTTHLYWDPALVDVKIAQAKYLLSRVAGFRKSVADRYRCCSPSVIIAGDFNSVPGDQVYECMISNSDQRPGLSSAYAFTGGEPAFTNCTPGFTATIDYIFFSRTGSVTPVSCLELSERESADVAGGLPNFFHPSDHLPIGAEFAV
ncbi:hypothetical protein M569_12594, partial [Genlisea aurea]